MADTKSRKRKRSHGRGPAKAQATTSPASPKQSGPVFPIPVPSGAQPIDPTAVPSDDAQWIWQQMMAAGDGNPPIPATKRHDVQVMRADLQPMPQELPSNIDDWSFEEGTPLTTPALTAPVDAVPEPVPGTPPATEPLGQAYINAYDYLLQCVLGIRQLAEAAKDQALAVNDMIAFGTMDAVSVVAGNLGPELTEHIHKLEQGGLNGQATNGSDGPDGGLGAGG